VNCAWTLHDAAYLLGALSPEDRHAYEEHLAGCSSCRAALAEVAGLPGLLGRLPADAIEAIDPPPADVLPALLAQVRAQRRRTRRRMRIAVAALATAAAVVAAALIGPGVVFPRQQATPTAFTRVADVPVSASAALVDKAWGTEIDLRCTYTGKLNHGSVAYQLLATDRAGNTRQVATWLVIEGKPIALVAATALKRSDLAWLEVRSSTDRTLLRLRT
jgi:hypothetical protein